MIDFVFPQDEATNVLSDKFQRQGGLSLRDYFASQALPMMITITAGKDIEGALNNAAILAYKCANEMLKVREKYAEQTQS